MHYVLFFIIQSYSVPEGADILLKDVQLFLSVYSRSAPFVYRTLQFLSGSRLSSNMFLRSEASSRTAAPPRLLSLPTSPYRQLSSLTCNLPLSVLHPHLPSNHFVFKRFFFIFAGRETTVAVSLLSI